MESSDPKAYPGVWKGIEDKKPIYAPYDWPEDFSGENGNYQNKCVVCQMLFIGHKGRAVCRVCAEKHGDRIVEGNKTIEQIIAEGILLYANGNGFIAKSITAESVMVFNIAEELREYFRNEKVAVVEMCREAIMSSSGSVDFSHFVDKEIEKALDAVKDKIK
jgi:hypothetical protein